MRYDAAIIGGSFAGLTAATYLARGRHSVLIIDTGTPRNRMSPAAHGFFAMDGASPQKLIAAARADLQDYDEASLVAGEAETVSGDSDAFHIRLKTGEAFGARRLVLAHGIEDVLPDIEGLVERWGTSVLHCPYCHGYEFSGKRLGVLATGPMSVHQALVISNWGTTTLLLNGETQPSDDDRKALNDKGVVIERANVLRAIGPRSVRKRSALRGVELADGRILELEALYVSPGMRLRSPISEQLHCTLDDTPAGQIIKVGPNNDTSTAGVFAAGDITRWPSNAILSAASGAIAGAAASQSLILGNGAN